MSFLQFHLSGFIILFVLGLRHGLDPDHITVIDNFTYKLHQHKSKWSRWVGTLFTIGHGLMVILISVILSLLKNNIEFPEWFNESLEWVPVVILLGMAISNTIILSNVNSGKQKTISGFRSCLLPKHSDNALNPFSIIVTGLIFGFIFSNCSVWYYHVILLPVDIRCTWRFGVFIWPDSNRYLRFLFTEQIIKNI